MLDMTMFATYATAKGILVVKPIRMQDMAVTAAVTVTISRRSSGYLSILQVQEKSKAGFLLTFGAG